MEKYYIPLLFGAVLVLVLLMKFVVKPMSVNVNNQATQSANATFPSAEELTNWPVYTNSVAGYSLKYPLTWKLEAVTANLIQFFPKESAHDSLINENEIFRIESGHDSRELSYLKSEYYPQALETTVGGKPALVDNKKLFAIIKSTASRSIEVRGVKVESGKYFDQILSTFKFL